MATTDAWFALADPTRRAVLARVASGVGGATDIAADLPVSRPAVSQHLKVLLAAELVDVSRQGRHRIYTVRSSGLETVRRELDAFWDEALANLKVVAERDVRSLEIQGQS